MPTNRRITSWGIGLKFAAAFLVTLAILSIVNRVFIPALLLPFNTYVFSCGIALIVLGVAVCFKAAVQVHQAFNQGKLATPGIYAHVRNPVYAVWILLIAPGLILATGFLLLIALPFVMYALVRVLIVEEDEHLAEKFGEDYLEYKKRVNSIIPT